MKKSVLKFTSLFTLAAVMYNSWPLGYLLDNYTARYGVASDLEDPSHPYSWVFITGDVLFAFLVVGLTIYLYNLKPKLKLRYVWLSLCFGLFLFAFFTGFGAAAPDSCHGFGRVCINVLNKRMSIDGIETSLAALGLLIALVSSAVLSRALSRSYRIGSWLVFGLWFLLGYVLSYKTVASQNVHSIQEVFLIMCGVGLISIGLVIDRFLVSHPHTRQHTEA